MKRSTKGSEETTTGGSRSDEAKQWEEGEINKLKVVIAKAMEEKNQVEIDTWIKDRHREQDQKLKSLAGQVLRGMRERPKEKAEIFQRTLAQALKRASLKRKKKGQESGVESSFGHSVAHIIRKLICVVNE